MGAYLLRRVLLMIPALVGVTFLVFCLISLSPAIGLPGDVGGGGATGRARQMAALDDRYGLRDPLVIQYARWLVRASPLRFGTRDQIAPDGAIVRVPRQLPEPTLWRWFADQLHSGSGPAPGAPDERAYRDAAEDYAAQRAEYRVLDARLRLALGEYARAAGESRAVSRDGAARPARLTAHVPIRSLPQWREAEALGRETVEAYGRALAAATKLRAVIRARPFPEAGIPLIPGVLSIAVPDLGRTVNSEPAARAIGNAVTVTLGLNLLAFLTVYSVAIPVGVRAACRRGGRFDLAAGSALLALWSVPTVWAATAALVFLASRTGLGLFPISGLHSIGAEQMTFLPGRGPDGEPAPGYALDTLWHVALPVLCLACPGFAFLAKQTRAAVLDNLRADHVRAARAKGLSEREVVLRHVLRNSLTPLITMFVQVLPAMLAGSVVVERVFSIQGMGSLMLAAIEQRDRELILANTLMVALVTMAALLLADVLYAMADPRVTYK
jgi:peptide/nickel transport system permease protein